MKKIITCFLVLTLVALASEAATIDVTTIGSSGTVNGAIFFGIDPQSTGTGIIDPFLREQNNGTEYGVNTSVSSPPYNDKSGPWTHDLAVSSLAPINYGWGVGFSIFLSYIMSLKSHLSS